MSRRAKHTAVRTAAAIIAAVMLFACASCSETEGKVKKITSFESVTLTVTNGRGWTEEYEITGSEAGAVLSLYKGSWLYNESVSKESDCLEGRREGGKELYEDIIALMNECKVGSWNGFSKSAKNVLDGYMFTFTAKVNGGEKIYATGSNAYPRRYSEFRDAVTEIIKGN